MLMCSIFGCAQSLTKLPIIVKGIQCVEDVELAAQQGADAVVLSNHGGRSLDLYVLSLSCQALATKWC